MDRGPQSMTDSEFEKLCLRCGRTLNSGGQVSFVYFVSQIFCINTSYLTDSYNVFTLKMESVSTITIFGLKMMVKSGLEKIILKSLHAGRWLFLLLNL